MRTRPPAPEPIEAEIIVEVELPPGTQERLDDELEAHTIATCIEGMVENPLDVASWRGELERRLVDAFRRARAGR